MLNSIKKNKMKNTIKIFILLFSITLCLNAQQDAQFTQYMYNMSVINPAYTTDDEGVLNMGLIHRSQWSGITGAPKTTNLFFHTPINNKIETGFTITNDNVGDIVKENNINGDFAYKLDLEENGMLSFGLKVGVTLFDVDFTGFNIEDQSDFGFAFQNINESFFNLGAGIFYNTDNYYVGLSVPNFLKSSHLEVSDGQYRGVEEVHWYFTGGYVFDINEQFKLKPAFMTKAVKGAPIALDLTLNMLYNERFELGIAYRVDDAVSALANFRVNDALRIGYAYDYTTSNLGTYSNGSHEILILYDLNIFGRGYDKSPRFF